MIILTRIGVVILKETGKQQISSINAWRASECRPDIELNYHGEDINRHGMLLYHIHLSEWNMI